MDTTNSIKNHFFLKEDANLEKFCTPLREVNIFNFTYMKNFYDGSQVYLSNLSKWIEDYYTLGFYKKSLFEASPESYKKYQTIWSSHLIDCEVIHHGRNAFNSDYGISLIEKHEDGTAFYFFSTDKERSNIFNFYINNLAFLERFIVYFNDVAKKLLKKSETHKITIPEHIRKKELNPLLFSSEIVKQAEETQALNSYYFRQGEWQGIKLSKQEIKCAMGLLQHKTSKQLAAKMNISKRTVDYYFDNLKNKLYCESRTELHQKLRQNGFLSLE